MTRMAFFSSEDFYEYSLFYQSDRWIFRIVVYRSRRDRYWNHRGFHVVVVPIFSAIRLSIPIICDNWVRTNNCSALLYPKNKQFLFFEAHLRVRSFIIVLAQHYSWQALANHRHPSTLPLHTSLQKSSASCSHRRKCPDFTMDNMLIIAKFSVFEHAIYSIAPFRSWICQT